MRADGNSLKIGLWSKYWLIHQKILEDLEVHAFENLSFEASLTRLGTCGSKADALSFSAELMEGCRVVEYIFVRFI